ADLGAELRGVLQQQMVEGFPLDLVRVGVRPQAALEEIEAPLHGPVVADELRAVLEDELLLLQKLRQFQAIEELLVQGEERLADVEAREMLPLEDDGLEARPRQDAGGRRARGTSPDDRGVVHHQQPPRSSDPRAPRSSLPRAFRGSRGITRISPGISRPESFSRQTCRSRSSVQELVST